MVNTFREAWFYHSGLPHCKGTNCPGLPVLALNDPSPGKSLSSGQTVNYLTNLIFCPDLKGKGWAESD